MGHFFNKIWRLLIEMYRALSMFLAGAKVFSEKNAGIRKKIQ